MKAAKENVKQQFLQILVASKFFVNLNKEQKFVVRWLCGRSIIFCRTVLLLKNGRSSPVSTVYFFLCVGSCDISLKRCVNSEQL